MPKDCNDNQIRNPATGRCVKKTSPLGKKLLNNGNSNEGTKKCPENQRLNPSTKRCVKKTGSIGRKLTQTSINPVASVPIVSIGLINDDNINQSANMIQNAMRGYFSRRVAMNKYEYKEGERIKADLNRAIINTYDFQDAPYANVPKPKIKRTNKRNELQDEFYDAPYAAESKKTENTLKRGRKIKEQLNKAIINSYDFQDAPYAAESKKTENTLKRGRKIKEQLNKVIRDVKNI
jgi:hypothetical protein